VTKSSDFAAQHYPVIPLFRYNEEFGIDFMGKMGKMGNMGLMGAEIRKFSSEQKKN